MKVSFDHADICLIQLTGLRRRDLTGRIHDLKKKLFIFVYIFYFNEGGVVVLGWLNPTPILQGMMECLPERRTKNMKIEDVNWCIFGGIYFNYKLGL